MRSCTKYAGTWSSETSAPTGHTLGGTAAPPRPSQEPSSAAENEAIVIDDEPVRPALTAEEKAEALAKYVGSK